MTRVLVLTCLVLFQTVPPPTQTTPPAPTQTTPPPSQTAPAPPVSSAPSVITRTCEPPVRNVQTLYYDDVFMFAGRTFGDRREGSAQTEPGLFVHSKEKNRWLQIMAISTIGGRLGRSWTDDPQAQRRLRSAPIGWDFTSFASRPYIDQPLKTTGSVAFPDHISFDETTGQYEVRYFSSFGVPSAETVLFIKRIDLILAFLKR